MYNQFWFAENIFNFSHSVFVIDVRLLTLRMQFRKSCNYMFIWSFSRQKCWFFILNYFRDLCFLFFLLQTQPHKKRNSVNFNAESLFFDCWVWAMCCFSFLLWPFSQQNFYTYKHARCIHRHTHTHTHIESSFGCNLVAVERKRDRENFEMYNEQ